MEFSESMDVERLKHLMNRGDDIVIIEEYKTKLDNIQRMYTTVCKCSGEDFLRDMWGEKYFPDSGSLLFLDPEDYDIVSYNGGKEKPIEIGFITKK